MNIIIALFKNTMSTVPIENTIKLFTNYIIGMQMNERYDEDCHLHSVVHKLWMYGNNTPDDAKITAMCIEKLIQSGMYKYSSKEEIQGALLTTSIFKGYQETMRVLLKHGADINWKYPYDGRTVIYHAIGEKDYEMVKFMISKGADLNVRCDKGISPLDYAKEIDSNEKIIELIQMVL